MVAWLGCASHESAPSSIRPFLSRLLQPRPAPADGIRVAQSRGERSGVCGSTIRVWIAQYTPRPDAVPACDPLVSDNRAQHPPSGGDDPPTSRVCGCVDPSAHTPSVPMTEQPAVCARCGGPHAPPPLPNAAIPQHGCTRARSPAVNRASRDRRGRACVVTVA